MTQKVLAIANRGEIAIRIARTARSLGWRPVALLGKADRHSLAAKVIEDIQPVSSEFDPDAVVAAAKHARATALHPGYGFLSEHPELSAACEQAGILFIGPSPKTLEICGNKLATRAAAERANVPLLPASPALSIEDTEAWSEHAEKVGYPLIVKVSSAGGGRGLRVARSADDLDRAVRSALNEAGASGADATFYFEHYLEGARHVEVQVAGNGSKAVALGDRDCSLQRRHQKVIEEAPAPGLADETRNRAHSSAVAIAEEVGLKGLATVEFLHGDAGTLAFIEVNPRLQVEHTVTEGVTGMDLVEVQINIATGGALPEPVPPHGHAIQARLYAEDPAHEFLPSPGEIKIFDWPEIPGLRVDAGFASGGEVSGNYDPLLAKFIAHGPDRDAAIAILKAALARLQIAGIATNRPWLLKLLSDERFQSNTHDLSTAGDVTIKPSPPAKEDLFVAAQFITPVVHTRRSRRGRGSYEEAWQASGPFRIVSPATAVFHNLDEGWQETVSRGGRGGDEAPKRGWSPAPEGVAVLPVENGYELSTPRGRWIVAPGPLPRVRTGAGSSDGAVRSPMPGTILTVNVTPGQQVSEGDVLAVMNAMKIEITLAAPFNGRVADVHASDGELVGSRQVIVTVEPEEAAND